MARLSGKLVKVTFDLMNFSEKRMAKYQKTQKVAESGRIARFSKNPRIKK